MGEQAMPPFDRPDPREAAAIDAATPPLERCPQCGASPEEMLAGECHDEHCPFAMLRWMAG